jgi:hypothetical protein
MPSLVEPCRVASSLAMSFQVKSSIFSKLELDKEMFKVKEVENITKQKSPFEGIGILDAFVTKSRKEKE